MAHKYWTDGKSILFGPTRVLAPADHLVVDKGELMAVHEARLTRLLTPKRVDALWVAPERRVAGSESKKPQDLVDSHVSRRLARQLRDLRDVVDVACLTLRGFDAEYIDDLGREAEARNKRYRRHNLWRDLIRYQQSGVVILLVSGDADDDQAAWNMYQEVRKVVGAGPSVGAFLGTDKRRKA